MKMTLAMEIVTISSLDKGVQEQKIKIACLMGEIEKLSLI